MKPIDFTDSPSARHSLRLRLGRFFFAEEIPFGLAIVRILMCIACLLVTVPRWVHSRELFSSDGAPAPLSVNYGRPDLLPIPPGGMSVALMTVLTVCCVTGCIGWWTRTSLAIAAVLYTYLNLLDSLSTMTKYSVITSHVLFLLSVSQCGAVWSVDRWLRRRRLGLPPPESLADFPAFPAWPRRLLQLLIGVVYFGASITKMHTPAYFSGDQLLHWMMTNVNQANPIGEWLTLYPPLLIAFAYIAIVWEVLFVFLCWSGWGRIGMLTLGTLFHVMTTLTLGLYLFPITCISIYFAFVEPSDVSLWSDAWRRRSGILVRLASIVVSPTRSMAERIGRRATPFAGGLNSTKSFGLFAALLMTVTVGAVEWEYRIDPYGKRGDGGPLALREIEPEIARRMLGPDVKLREYDKFLSFDVGTDLFGGMVLGKKTTFRHGELIIAQCALSPPHEDMWVEVNLHDANNVTLDRVGQVVVRSQLRGNVAYRACEALQPGTYYLVLKTGGKEITRKAIEIVAGTCPAPALAN